MTYDGKALVLSDADKKAIEDVTANFFAEFQALDSGRTSGWTSAVNIEELIEAVATNSGKKIECSSVLLGEYGYEDVSFGIPVSVGKEGIISYELPELTIEQKYKLNEISKTMKETLNKIDF